MASILIVEDSKEYQFLIERALMAQDLGVPVKLTICGSGQEAFEAFKMQTFDLAILDIVLDEMSGLQLCSFIRNDPTSQNMMIFFLTSKDSQDDKIRGLEYGADDYLTKPFDIKELQLRVKALLRRIEPPSAPQSFQVGELQVDTEKLQVKDVKSGQTIELTKKEYLLLVLFLQHPERVYSREELLDQVWTDKVSVSDRTVDAHISHIRKKTLDCGIKIESVSGLGYRLILTT